MRNLVTPIALIGLTASSLAQLSVAAKVYAAIPEKISGVMSGEARRMLLFCSMGVT